jgi:hypothetical protein
MPVEILFCDRCHESIPDADLENGRAVRVSGRVLHVPCAFRRALPGPGRALTFVIALLALGGAAFAVSRELARGGEKKGPVVAMATQADLDGSVATLRDALKGARDEDRKALEEKLASAVAGMRADVMSRLDAVNNAQHSLDRRVDAEATGHLKRVEQIERELGELQAFVKEVRDLAKATPPSPAPAPTAPPPTSAPAPVPAAPPPAAPPSAGPPAPTTALDPEAQRRHDAELEKWIKLLKDSDPGVSFSATYKLKDLKDLRAWQALVDTLKTHKDYYTRLGAATALGELKACDAVSALIDALEDKEDLVQTAAGEALSTITGRESKPLVGLTKKERRAVKDEWGRWWKENETAVRARLNQPASGATR